MKKPHQHRAAYRLEIHFTETGKCYAEVHDADFHREPLWESKIYDDLDDCLSAGRWEVDRRAEIDREAAHVKRMDEHDRAPLTYQQQARDNGISSAGW